LTQGELLDELRLAQGWPHGRYVMPPAALLDEKGGLVRRAGWRKLSQSMLKLVGHDNLAEPARLDASYGYSSAPLPSRLLGW
ncbi:epimerase, partial [Pseudomonas aeruginosa]